jgi:UDP-N-acetylmuramate dehydrogenase
METEVEANSFWLETRGRRRPGITEPFEGGRRNEMKDLRERDVKDIRRLIEGTVLVNVPMKRFTSIKAGGPADGLFFPRDVDELRTVMRAARKRGLPTLILGKGTNLIVTGKGFRGWMISLTRGLTRFQIDGEVVEAEAGVVLQRLVRSSALKGLTGLEAFFGIPGTVGGGLAMNAGAWGEELKDRVLSVTFMNEEGERVERARSRLRFSYRSLHIPPSWVVLKGRFQLEKGNKEEILGRIKSYSEMRKRSQPLDYPSAGSVFKNPKEGPAGRWIEEAGLKGFRIGQAMVSDRHANFIVNLGRATAEEIVELMEWVERVVYKNQGISLEREVRVVGE